MSQATTRAENADFELLLKVELDIDAFASDWAYCDRLSSYAARMVSHNRADSLLYSNLFSSALNELLETVFRSHRPGGAFVCSILRRGGMDRIELAIPCGPEDVGFYRQAMETVVQDDAAEQYRTALFAEGPLDPGIGLFELAVDYEAAMSVERLNDNSIRLVADFALEEAQV